jgi:hypothetical protein
MDNEEKILEMLQEIRSDQLLMKEVQRKAMKRYRIIVRILLPILAIFIVWIVWSAFSSQK